MTAGDHTEGSAAKVALRPLTEADFTERYLAWFADPVVTRFLEARNITCADAIEHLRQGLDDEAWRLYAICHPDDGRHVGNLKIGPIDWRHRVSDLVTVIGDRTAWGQGLARAAIAQGVAIAFGDLNLRKLSASIDARNIGSIKAYTAAGFAVEARLPDQFMDCSGAEPVLSDKVYVGCFNPEFEPESDPKRDQARLGS